MHIAILAFLTVLVFSPLASADHHESPAGEAAPAEAAPSSEPAAEAEPEAAATEPAPEPERERHPVLFYIPNRIFDLLDVVRARVRVGPGVSVGVRVTDVADVFFGAHTTAYVGLHGPRGKPKIPWPFGVENEAGVEISVVGEKTESEFGADYGATEIGAGAQVLALGIDVGVDPLEILDFVTGIVFIDLIDDDY